MIYQNQHKVRIRTNTPDVEKPRFNPMPLKAWRDSVNISNREIAEKLDIPLSQLEKALTGDYYLKESLLIKIDSLIK